MTEQFIIDKELIFAMSKVNMSKTEWKVFWNIFIHNYNNVSSELSLSLLQELVVPNNKKTQNKKANESVRSLTKLIKRKIIIKIIKGNGQNANVYAVNKNTAEWEERHV